MKPFFFCLMFGTGFLNMFVTCFVVVFFFSFVHCKYIEYIKIDIEWDKDEKKRKSIYIYLQRDNLVTRTLECWWNKTDKTKRIEIRWNIQRILSKPMNTYRHKWCVHRTWKLILDLLLSVLSRFKYFWFPWVRIY